MDDPKGSAESAKLLFTLLMIANLGLAWILIPHRPGVDASVAEAVASAASEQMIDDIGAETVPPGRERTRETALLPGGPSRALGWELAGEDVVTKHRTRARPAPTPLPDPTPPLPAPGPTLAPAPEPTGSEPPSPQPTPAPTTTTEPAPTTTTEPPPPTTTTEPPPTTTTEPPPPTTTTPASATSTEPPPDDDDED